LWGGEITLSCNLFGARVSSLDPDYTHFEGRLVDIPIDIDYSSFHPQSITEKVEGLLEIVRYYSEKNEESNGLQETINSLINFGFPMDEIQQALRVTSNNQIAACEWLLEHSSSTQNSNALRESIFVESHIIKVLLSTPQVQMTLSSPRFFSCYISMLENYSSLNIFFTDIESQNLLQLILRTYHEERIYFHTFSSPLPL
jgi:UBA/TS-N domain